jgi:CheY-like chemotaxis protein
MTTNHNTKKLKKILIVEDDESHAYLAKYVIRDLIATVTIDHVWDGQEALEYLQTTDICPDIILLDINMPRLDGFGFLEAVSGKNALKDPSVIMLSSSSLSEDKNKAKDRGAYGYLIKPLNIDELVWILNDIGFVKEWE